MQVGKSKTKTHRSVIAVRRELCWTLSRLWWLLLDLLNRLCTHLHLHMQLIRRHHHFGHERHRQRQWWWQQQQQTPRTQTSSINNDKVFVLRSSKPRFSPKLHLSPVIQQTRSSCRSGKSRTDAVGPPRLNLKVAAAAAAELHDSSRN